MVGVAVGEGVAAGAQPVSMKKITSKNSVRCMGLIIF